MIEIEMANASSININNETLSVQLDDGRTVVLPISWYPRLYHTTDKERQNYRFIGNRSGIHWEDLDEDISVEGIIAGHRSRESQESLGRWLKNRIK